MTGRQIRGLARDTLVVVVALGLLVYEVIWGGGRAAVVTALVGLLLSPVLMRVDEARRRLPAKEEDAGDH